ncbi:MAG: alpha-amylase [Rhodospirillaceae bacterium]|nr:alpha-amylase [Rhodospirillaceae bacterium]
MRTVGALLASVLVVGPSFAHESHDDETPSVAGMALSGDGVAPINADSHAPIGVMGDHMHHEGEWMLSYRFMRMVMEGNRIGRREVSPQEIATTIANPFFGQPGQPPFLRVVPTDMTMDMHMFGAMYAPNDWLTLMGMAQYLVKSMDHITFQGGAGTNVLGTFTTRTKGLGDTSIAGLVRLWDDGVNHLHLNVGLGLPTGRLDKTDDVLAPNGARPVLRVPYAMQLGSGTFDLLPGITYTGHSGEFGWGAQYRATMRLGKNDEGYRLGDIHRLTAWASYRWAPWISTSLRLAGERTGKIEGQDARIVAPVQTADPANYGGDRLDVLFGVNLVAQNGSFRGHRLAIEFGMPVYQDLNGPQMQTDYQVTAGWQYAF